VPYCGRLAVHALGSIHPSRRRTVEFPRNDDKALRLDRGSVSLFTFPQLVRHPRAELPDKASCVGKTYDTKLTAEQFSSFQNLDTCALLHNMEWHAVRSQLTSSPLGERALILCSSLAIPSQAC